MRVGGGETGQDGRRLLMCGPTVVAVRSELGWWSLEERRQKKKALYGRRMDDDRLVKRVSLLM